MIRIKCIDDGAEYWFLAATPYEAMTKMLYTLEISGHDTAAKINKTESGLHLYIDFLGKTYAVVNK